MRRFSSTLSRLSLPITTRLLWLVLVMGLLLLAMRLSDVLRAQTRPANDDFANAQPLTGLAGSVRGSNDQATEEENEADEKVEYTFSGGSVWYRWQAPSNGVFNVALWPANFEPTIIVYTGLSLTDLVAVQPDNSSGVRSKFRVVAGRRYYIAVLGFLSHGNFTLSWRFGEPANDSFSQAQIISGDTGSVEGNSLGATREQNEPAHTSPLGGHSLWYRWQAPGTGPVTFTATNPDLGILLAVYTGASVTTLSEVTADRHRIAGRSSVTFLAQANQTYFVALDVESNRTGVIALKWKLGVPDNDNFASAEPLSGLAGRIIGNNAQATSEAAEPNHAGQPSGPSIWYRWVAPVSAPVRFSILSSSFVTTLAVYTGSSVGALTAVANSGNETPKQARFNAITGRAYFIAVTGSTPGFPTQGAIVLNWTVGLSIAGQTPYGSGVVRFPEPTSFGLGAVTITLSGDENRVTTADAFGRYIFANLAAGRSYTVTPSYYEFSKFNPRQHQFSPLTNDQTEASFAPLPADFRDPPPPPLLNGRVRDEQNRGLTGLRLSLTGAATATVEVNDQGYYEVERLLEAGKSYTLTPLNDLFRFVPPSLSFTVPPGGQIIAPFNGTGDHTVRGQIKDQHNAFFEEVTTLSLAGAHPPVRLRVDANYSFKVVNGANLQLTPAAAGYFFTPMSYSFANVTGERTADFRVSPLVTNVSAASFAPAAVAVESIVAAYGRDLATSIQTGSTVPLPTDLAGTTIKVRDARGTERLAPLFFVSPGQVNYQMPPDTVLGTAIITVTNGAGVLSMGATEVTGVEPGLFSANTDGQGPAAAVLLRVTVNGSLSYEPVIHYDSSLNRFVLVPIDFGAATDQLFLILFGTGFRFRASLSEVAASVGGVSAPVLFAGAQMDFVGTDQANVRLARSLIGRGEVDVALTVGGKSTNRIKVSFK